MTDEEKKAIEFINFYKDMCMNRELSNLEHYETINDGEFIYKNLETALNLIEKQQKEIEKKDKIIDLTIKVLTDCEFDDKCQECTYDQLYQCNKEYFTKKAEEN